MQVCFQVVVPMNVGNEAMSMLTLGSGSWRTFSFVWQFAGCQRGTSMEVEKVAIWLYSWVVVQRICCLPYWMIGSNLQ